MWSGLVQTNDFARGGMGNDLSRGGPGRDMLRGGPGFDTCIGGGGKDIVTVRPRDVGGVGVVPPSRPPSPGNRR